MTLKLSDFERPATGTTRSISTLDRHCGWGGDFATAVLSRREPSSGRRDSPDVPGDSYVQRRFLNPLCLPTHTRSWFPWAW